MAVNSFVPVTPTFYPTTDIVANMSLTAASGDTVNVFTVPAGFTMTGLRVDFVGTTSSTIEVGDSGNLARFIAASTSTGSTGSVTMNVTPTATSGVVTAGPGYKFPVSTTIVATIGGASVSAKQYTFHAEGYMDMTT